MSKMWGDHSSAWRSKASAEGLSPQRWNAWNKLSAKSQSETSQRDYAAGLTVKDSVKEERKRKAFRKMRRVSKLSDSQLRYKINNMHDIDVKWTADASIADIKDRAAIQTNNRRFGNVSDEKGRNPWWYR